MRLQVDDAEGRPLGEIWDEGDSTIKSSPDSLVGVIRQFLVALPGAAAPTIVAAMDGYSNGYVVIRRVG